MKPVNEWRKQPDSVNAEKMTLLEVFACLHWCISLLFFLLLGSETEIVIALDGTIESVVHFDLFEAVNLCAD